MLNFVIFFSIACSSQESSLPTIAHNDAIQQRSKITVINVEEFKERWEKQDIIVLDVRTLDEFNAGHVPKAKHIPLHHLPKQFTSLSQYKNQDIYLICAVGGRSEKAQELLLKEGFSKAINVDGGTNEWASKGYPLEK